MLITKIKQDMKQAMKDKEKAKLSTLRMLLSTIENKRVELKLNDVHEIEYKHLIACINKNIKQVKQQIESLVKANRDTTEQLAEIAVLETYLPRQMSEDEIRNVISIYVEQNPKANIGQVLSYFSNMYRGEADMKLASKIANEIINKGKK